jgi:signal transduction histidine kinase
VSGPAPAPPASSSPSAAPNLLYLALVPPAIVAVVFTGLELLRRQFFRDVDPEIQIQAHLALDIVGIYATTSMALWFVLRDRARAEAERARERDRREQERVRTASLVATGELAAAVAHELKNPLQGILGAIDIIARDFPPGDRRAIIAKELSAQVNRLDETVRDLLVFARPQVPRPSEVELRPFVERLFAFVHSERDVEAVSLATEIPDGLRVTADPSMLEEVLMNLILNAAQAMEGKGGVVTVGARRDARGAAVVSVADTGCGIAPEIREEVWKPFYTTKHRGSGLGLTIVRKIVEAHGGAVTLESEVGRGTTFRVTLP